MRKRFLLTLGIFLVSFIFLVVLVNELGIFGQKDTTYVAEIKELKVETEKQGLIFRDESLIASSISGVVEFLVEDGERVPANTPIAKITQAPVNNGYDVYQVPDDLDIQYNEINDEYLARQDELSFMVNEGRLDEIELVEKDIRQLLLVKQTYEAQGGIKATEIGIQTNYVDGSYQVIAPRAGIVAYEMFGSDPLYNINNRFIINYDKLDIPDPKEGRIYRETEANQPFIRIVNNKMLYIIIQVTEDEVMNYSENMRIDATINETVINPVVESIFPSGDHYGIVLRVTEDFPDMHNLRVINFKVTPKAISGLYIKNKSIIEQEGQQGVYILRKDGKREFLPIRIISTVGDESIIYSDYYTMLNENGITESITTVSLYDEIVENPGYE